jgi:hypothetical protein
MMSRRAVFPRRAAAQLALQTGLAGRPVPVEQSDGRPRFARTMLTQLAEPFTAVRTEQQ